METKSEVTAPSPDHPRRVIKRYPNRKLYDTKDSRYVTLLQIAEMVREGEEVQIIDNNTKDDLTEVVLAQIIYEEQKAHSRDAESRNVPLQTLKDLIHQRTERVLEGLREGPIGRLIPGQKTADGKPAFDEKLEETKKAEAAKVAEAAKTALFDQAKEKFEDFQHQMDERVRSALASFRPLQQLQLEVKRLNERIEELENKLKGPPGS